MAVNFVRKPAPSRLAVVTGVLALLMVSLVVFSETESGDYHVRGPVGGDNAGPGIEYLLHGNLWGYVSHQPVIGLTSILLRLPLAGLASALGSGSLRIYQLGALACLLPLAWFAAWLISQPSLTSRQRRVRVLAMLAVIASPILRSTVASGHPEGVVTGILSVAAVLMATRGRARWAGVLLGLAIAGKEWAVVAAVPVLMALPGKRREAILAAGGAAFLFAGLVWLADPAAWLRALHGEGAARFVSPLSLVWLFSAKLYLPHHQVTPARAMPLQFTRTDVTLLATCIAGLITAVWYRRALRQGNTFNPLAMLALLGALRCACDSTHEMYYYVAILIPVAAWEATENRPPVVTVLVSLVVTALYGVVGHTSPSYIYLGSLTAEVLLALYLASYAMAPNPPGGPEDLETQLPPAYRAMPELLARVTPWELEEPAAAG